MDFPSLGIHGGINSRQKAPKFERHISTIALINPRPA
jgi:hypothetical protein